MTVKKETDKYLASMAELQILSWVYFSESLSMWFLHDTFCPHLMHINCLNKIQDNNIKIHFNVIRFETSGFSSNTNFVPQNKDYFDCLYFCFRMVVQTFLFLSFTVDVFTISAHILYILKFSYTTNQSQTLKCISLSS